MSIRGFLYKDIALSKKMMMLTFALAAAFSAFAVFAVGLNVDEELLEARPLLTLITGMMSFFCAGMMNISLFQNDENKKWLGFAASAPRGLTSSLAAKYILMFGMLAAVMLTIFLYDLIASQLMGAESYIKIYLVIFGVQLAISALESPFVVRFGAEKGGGIKAAAIGLVLVAAEIYFLFGDISMFTDKESDEILADLQNIMTDGLTAAAIIVPTAAAVLFFASFIISSLLYRKGAENFE